MAFLLAHKAEILGSLWVLSEALGSIPSIKQNAVYQVVWSILKLAVGKK